MHKMLGIINLKGDTSRKKRKRLARTLKLDKTLRMHTHIHTHSHTHTFRGKYIWCSGYITI